MARKLKQTPISFLLSGKRPLRDTKLPLKNLHITSLVLNTKVTTGTFGLVSSQWTLTDPGSSASPSVTYTLVSAATPTSVPYTNSATSVCYLLPATSAVNTVALSSLTIKLKEDGVTDEVGGEFPLSSFKQIDGKPVTLEMGKTTVIAKDTPGFIVNRIARPFYGEALRIYEEGIADIATIDAAMRQLNFRMGPFELMDLIGNDVNHAVSCSVYEQMNKNERFKPSYIQEQKVKEGKLGKKSGEGFYKYSP